MRDPVSISAVRGSAQAAFTSHSVFHLARILSINTAAALALTLNSCGGGGTSPTPIPTQTGPTVTGVSISPDVTSLTIGAAQQFSATVSGTGAFSSAVSWSATAPAGSSLSPGTISSTGLYTTPYPAPATVTVSATSSANAAIVGSVTFTLSPPATATGPAISVDAGNQIHAISPYVYGMNAYLINGSAADAAAVNKTNITIDRWGGDSTERYNYQLDVTNDIADRYFENQPGSAGDGWIPVTGASAFDNLVQYNNQNGIKTIGTVPVNGWVSKDSTSCGFPTSTYPNQTSADSVRGCGSGKYAQGVNGCAISNGCGITGNSPSLTSISAPPPAPAAAGTLVASSWTGTWVSYLVNKFGPGNPATGTGTGVAIYDLDNEPEWWDTNTMDVHPNPTTYDELTTGGIGTALAIKTSDPTAEVSGPVVNYWWSYFYSTKDIDSGWSSAGGPCFEPWSKPIDREAHNGTPFIQYYLQQFAQAQTTYGIRLLDYLDLHAYLGGTYNGTSAGLTTAGDTGMQQARLNSTRALWDPTYIDPNYPQPNYITDANYTTSCAVPPQAPQLIPRMKGWVAASYPGTKLAIDEYNWGGMESINGALAQADILGIFGAYGLDLGTMWPTGDPSGQIPGMMAFAIYRNYDGNKSTFGDMALSATSTNQAALSVYAALRSSDKAITIMVINKTFGDLTDSILLANATPSGAAQAYLYSNANLAAIVAQPAIPVKAPGNGSTTSTISTAFPAQSITLLVVPQS